MGLARQGSMRKQSAGGRVYIADADMQRLDQIIERNNVVSTPAFVWVELDIEDATRWERFMHWLPVIHPERPFKTRCTMVILLLLLYISIVVPLQASRRKSRRRAPGFHARACAT